MFFLTATLAGCSYGAAESNVGRLSRLAGDAMLAADGYPLDATSAAHSNIARCWGEQADKLGVTVSVLQHAVDKAGPTEDPLDRVFDDPKYGVVTAEDHRQLAEDLFACVEESLSPEELSTILGGGAP